MNNKKTIKELSTEDVKKWGDKIGERLHLTHVDVLCLKNFVIFFQKNPQSGTKYVSIFNYFYRLFWDRLCINIYKLLDVRKDVISVSNFFINCGQKAKWENLKKNDVFKKIRARRHDKIAHDNLNLALNQKDDQAHYNQNKQTLSEIVSFLEIVKSEFEQVLSEKGFPIYHYALGKGKESSEFKELLYKVFNT